MIVFYLMINTIKYKNIISFFTGEERTAGLCLPDPDDYKNASICGDRPRWGSRGAVGHFSLSTFSTYTALSALFDWLWMWAASAAWQCVCD